MLVAGAEFVRARPVRRPQGRRLFQISGTKKPAHWLVLMLVAGAGLEWGRLARRPQGRRFIQIAGTKKPARWLANLLVAGAGLEWGRLARRPQGRRRIQIADTKNQLDGWLICWLRGPDSNRRPSGYEPDELPGCSTPRQRLRILRLAIHGVNRDGTNGARDRKIMTNR